MQWHYVTVTCLLLLVYLPRLHSSDLRWLALGLSPAASRHAREMQGCDSLAWLSLQQLNICRQQGVHLMNAVRLAARTAIGECQTQFRARRWNCSTVDEPAIFGSILSQGTREAAFVQAISSASVLHTVTRACSRGELERCGCDKTLSGLSADGGFQWSGCSENVAYGSAFSRTFVDAPERAPATAKQAGASVVAPGNSGHRRMHLHNSEAGRKSVETQVNVQCKCHGVSGSCELKTCWRALPSFRDVGTRLRSKFDTAIEVEWRKVGSRDVLQTKGGGGDAARQPTEDDLVYLVPSPDFCLADSRAGSFGTEGRPCARTSRSNDSCEQLCCGRGYIVQTRRIESKCKCKFHWCCHVQCSICERVVERQICR